MPGKKLFKNFIMLDGSREAEAEIVNLELDSEKINRVGSFKSGDNYEEIIDGGKEKYLFPGFIDLHSHGDLMNFAAAGLEAKISQGVTTEVTGQCGLGAAPLRQNIKNDWQKHMIIRNPLSELPWNSVAEYFSYLNKAGLDNNLLYFLPHGLLRYYIKKGKKTEMNKKELIEYQKIIEKSLREGASGVSLGLCYFPAVYSNFKELKILFEVAGSCDKLISVHLKSEGTKILESLAEIIKLREGSKSRVNISHLKIIGRENEYKLEQLLKMIEDNGLTFDSYPYNFGSTSLEIIIPPDFLEDSGLDILNNPEIRKKLKKIYNNGENPYDNWDNLPYLLGWENIYLSALSSNKRSNLIGLSLAEIAEKWEMEAADAAFKLLVEEENILMQDYYMQESILKTILRHQSGSIGTDSLFSKSNPHPRTYQTYPKILKKYVFEEKILSLAEALNKFTKKPAQVLGLKNRGEIAPGKKADLVIFSKKDLLNGENNGISGVLINGSWKLKNGEYIGSAKPGQIIK
jgi:N-acyl-D-aspartate/D-glutamate deacylase